MSDNLERCCRCYTPTGRAGIADDSMYTMFDEGPLCEDCYEEPQRYEDLIDSLTAERDAAIDREGKASERVGELEDYYGLIDSLRNCDDDKDYAIESIEAVARFDRKSAARTQQKGGA